jgi:hypothetical protein
MTPSNRYRSGAPDLDAAIVDLLAAAELLEDLDLHVVMLVSAVRLGRASATRGDNKLVNAALKESRSALQVFAPAAPSARARSSARRAPRPIIRPTRPRIGSRPTSSTAGG